MHWMADWPTPFPLFVAEAKGAHFKDVDGHAYVDFCLGDTGAMFGHAPDAGRRRDPRSSRRAATRRCCPAKMPSGSATSSRAASACRSGKSPRRRRTPTAMPCAGRAPLTGRDKILVFDGCYHGTVEETMVRLKDGKTVPRAGQLGAVIDVDARDKRRRVQRHSRARSARSQRRRRRRAGRTRDDEHRHGAARARLPRRASRSDAQQARSSSSTKRTPSRPAPAAGRAPSISSPTSSYSASPLPAAFPCAVFGVTADVATAWNKRARKPARRATATPAWARPYRRTRSRCMRCAPTSNT